MIAMLQDYSLREDLHNASWANLYFLWLGFSDRVSLCGDSRYIKLAEDVIVHEHARNAGRGN